MKTFTAQILTILILASAFFLSSQPSAAAPRFAPTIRIASVSTLDLGTNTWTIQLSSGDSLRVELRAFDTGGKAPSVGQVSNFSDQGWLPILGYYGYATFDQNGIAYHATH